MMRVVALTFALSAASATALGALRSSAFLSSDMRPDMVAQSLKAVEEEWKAQAHVTAECKTQGALPTCAEAPRAFHNSCSKVIRAVMMGSQGDSVKVSEYMTSVCSQKTISGWQQSCCGFVGVSIVAKMSANPSENRENYVAKADATCNSLWIRFVEEQTAQVAIEAKAKVDDRMKASQALREAAKLAEMKLLHDMATKADATKADAAVDGGSGSGYDLATKESMKADSAVVKESIPVPFMPTRAEASAEKEAEASQKSEASMKQFDDAKIAATKSVKEAKAKVQEAGKKVGEKVKTTDAQENNIMDAFKSHPKIQEAAKKVGEKVKTTDASESSIKDAFKSHPKIQEAAKKVGEKVKTTDAMENSIKDAFKGISQLIR